MKKLIILFFMLSINYLFSQPLGNHKHEVFGEYPNDYIYVDCDSKKLYLIGSSKVQKIQQLPASVLKSPSTNPAEYVDLGLNGTFKFKKSVNEVVSCAIAIPFELDKSSNVAVRIGFCSQDTTGNCVFKLEYLYRSLNEDISSTTPTETLYSTTTVSGTSYGYTYANFNLLKPEANDKVIQMRITRMSSIDTVTNDIFVLGLSLVYYINKLGE